VVVLPITVLSYYQRHSAYGVHVSQRVVLHPET